MTDRVYDRAYFDKWYRHPRFRVKSPRDVERQLRFIVSATEYLFERPVKRVLDVGAGEGNWGVALRKIRPRAAYLGVDASEYAVARYGERRNLRLGSLGTLDTLRLGGPFDLVLCCGVLIYIAPDELRSGLRHVHRLTRGVAYSPILDTAGHLQKAAPTGAILISDATYEALTARPADLERVAAASKQVMPAWLYRPCPPEE